MSDDRKFQILLIATLMFVGALPFTSFPHDPHTGRICDWVYRALDAYLAGWGLCMTGLFIVGARMRHRDRINKFIEETQKNGRRKRNKYYYERRNKVQVNCRELRKEKICKTNADGCYCGRK